MSKHFNPFEDEHKSRALPPGFELPPRKQRLEIAVDRLILLAALAAIGLIAVIFWKVHQ